MGRTCELIEAILNGESVDFDPKTKTQSYLKACINKEGCENLPDPDTRAGALLYRLAHELKTGSTGGLTKLWSYEYNEATGDAATTTEAAVKENVGTVNIPEDARIFVCTAKSKNEISGYSASLNIYVKNTTDKFSGLYTFALKDGVAKSLSGVAGLYLTFGDETASGVPVNICAKKAASTTGDFNTSGNFDINLYAVESATELFAQILDM